MLKKWVKEMAPKKGSRAPMDTHSFKKEKPYCTKTIKKKTLKKNKDKKFFLESSRLIIDMFAIMA